VSRGRGLLNSAAATSGEICPETVGCTRLAGAGQPKLVAATSVSTPVHDLANEQEISLCSNNIRDNRWRGFLSAIEDPRDSLPPTVVVGERQRISARLVSAPSRSSWGVACSESTCRRVGVRLLFRAQWRWRVGRLNAGLGPAQTASSWPSTAPPRAVASGFALLDLHGNRKQAPARSS
jgi:hypothetical protein